MLSLAATALLPLLLAPLPTTAEVPPAADLGWEVLLADSTANVLRDGSISSGVSSAAATKTRLSVARNEFEAVQLVIGAGSVGVTDLRWTAVDEDAIPPLNITIAPLGDVHAGLSHGCPWNVTANPKCPTTMKPCIDWSGDGVVCKPRAKFSCSGCSEMDPWNPTDTTEWWPYPILDFITAVDVAPRSSQPLPLTVTPSSAAAPAGNYTVLVTLTTKEWSLNVSLEVEIYGFALPLTPLLLTFWGVSERDNPKLFGPRQRQRLRLLR
jgi:hypothetical protein